MGRAPRPLRLTLVLLVALACPAGANARSASGPHETTDLTYSTQAPGASTGASFSATYRNPTNPQASPPSLRRITYHALDPGGRVDTSVVPVCTATDMQLEMNGDAACPAASRIGAGSVTTVVLGMSPTTYATSIFNTDGGQVEVVKSGSGGVAVVRGSYNGVDFDTLIPTCVTGGQPPGGCPFDQTAVLTSTLSIAPITVNGRNYSTTPPVCPQSGEWRTAITFSYSDGAVETVVTGQPCTAAASAGRPQARPGPTPRARSHGRRHRRAGKRRHRAVHRRPSFTG